MPHRLGRHWRVLVIAIICSVSILIGIGISAVGVIGRANELNDSIYNQCIRDQNQDAIIIAQLKAARKRIPYARDTPEYRRLAAPINDGIAALRSDPPCNPPLEVEP